MKKFTFLSGMVLIATVVAVLFVSCQKEQSPVTDETASASSSENQVVGIAGTGSYAGSIDASYASSLAANYANKYNDADQTQYVSFSAKELVSFINSLRTKYKSDLIYVNFGVYGNGAKPLNDKDYGRLTVFFTGNKIPAPTSGHKTDDTTDDGSDAFLNHGGVFP